MRVSCSHLLKCRAEPSIYAGHCNPAPRLGCEVRTVHTRAYDASQQVLMHNAGTARAAPSGQLWMDAPRPQR